MAHSDSLAAVLVSFYTLQYPTTSPAFPDSFHHSTYYNVGPLDICMVISLIAVMAILRDALRLGFFEPLARWKLHRDLAWKLKLRTKAAHQNGTNVASNGVTNGNGHIANGNGAPSGKSNGVANGHAKVSAVSGPSTKELRQLNRSVLRFAEQGWSVVYYTIQWGFGLYVHYNLPTRVLDPIDIWREYPHIPIAGPVKFYYLTQNAFYLHQILILNAEARRKDHYQMMCHHVITVILILASYFTHFTRVGCVIMVLMDCCDIFLPLAKMIRYLGLSQFACDCVFGLFLVSWLITRHFLFSIIIWSTIFVGPLYVEFKWDWEGGYYVTQHAYTGFWVMLLFLEVIQIIWFGMICRVAYRVITGSGAADTRSDDENEPGKED
ncbi:LAG1-domain-containing protein [Pholiota conissans]|uniref:LAG1-domain-containing protein n=1 Tax=Pholiota conissans TaxID=109636 RepID=A0A9P6CW23_9AGAR|nr:LAG1-domain-containing protein [Pholiota conissans]